MALPSWSLPQVAFAFFPLYNSCMRTVISCFSGCDASTCLCVTYLLVLSTHVKDSAVLWAAVPLSVTTSLCWLSLLLNFRDVHLVLLEPWCQSGIFPTHTWPSPCLHTSWYYDFSSSIGIASSIFPSHFILCSYMCPLLSSKSLILCFYMVLSCLSPSSWWGHSWAVSSHTTTCKTFV